MYLEEFWWETDDIVKVGCFLYKFTESGLMGEGVTLRNVKIAVQAHLGAWAGFGIQSRYEDPGELRVE